MSESIQALFLLHILNDGYRSAVITLLPFLTRDLSLSLTQVGILSSSLSFIGMLLAVPSSFLAHRFGGFRVLIWCLLIYSVALLGIASAQSFLFVLAAYYITAIGFAFFHPISFALVTRLSGSGTRGKMMGNFMSVGDIGRLIIPSLMLLAIPTIGWRFTISVCAVVGIFCYLLVQLRVKSTMPVTTVKTAQIPTLSWFSDLARLLKKRPFQITLLSAIADTLASSSIFTFLPFLLLERGMTTSQLVFFTTAFFLGSLSGKSLLGMGVDRHGNRKIFMLSELAMAAVLVLLIFSQSFVIFLIISYLLGIFTRGTSPVIQTLISESIHDDHLERGFAISETLIQISAAVTLLAAGIIADYFGISAVYMMAALLAICATIPLVWEKAVNRV